MSGSCNHEECVVHQQIFRDEVYNSEQENNDDDNNGGSGDNDDGDYDKLLMNSVFFEMKCTVFRFHAGTGVGFYMSCMNLNLERSFCCSGHHYPRSMFCTMDL